MNRPNSDPQQAAENRHVSTAQVADALGVSVTTVKRWVDDGVLPARRTAGGHRKLRMADLLRAVRDGNLPQPNLAKLLPKLTTTADPAELYSNMCAAVTAFDADMIRGVVIGGYHAGVPIEVLADEVISPALALVGHEWEIGNLSVMHEHRVTQACVAALYELRAFLRDTTDVSRPVAIGGAPEHDHYVMPSLLAKLALIDAGWDAVNVGPHTPPAAFRAAVEQLKPQLLWVSASHVADPAAFLSGYRDLYKFCEARGVAVAIGGRAITDELRTKMPYTSFGDGLTHLAAFAKSLHRRPRRPKRGRPAA